MNESVKQVNVLTEEELQEYEQIDVTAFLDMNEVRKLIASHLTLNSRNADLVHENDELMAENEIQRKIIDYQHALLEKYESILNGG